jgi:serine/threonine protein kinase
MNISVQQFIQKLSDSGVLLDEDLAALHETLADPPETVEQLASELIQQNKLTRFQIEQINEGKGSRLVLGNYLILDEIGAGGMGEVYLAEHRRMKRQVALKVLPPAMIEDKQAVDRFQREVEAAAKLSHPNIVTAYDADQAGDVHFFVMEFVEGRDLAELVKKNGVLSVDQAVECVRQVATGLEFAHKKGVVHRDIKPANLLLDPEGNVKILDMGLARYQASQEEEVLTVSGMAMGTPDFMSPEQGVNAKHADERSDIYSLGCTLFYLLTGKKVYGGESLVEKVMAHQNEPIPSLIEACQDATPELDAIFQKMVAKQRGDRFQSAGALLAELESLSGGDIPTGSGGSSVPPPLKSLAMGGSEFAATILYQQKEEVAHETLVSSIQDDTMKKAQRVKAAVQGGTSGSRTISCCQV